MYGIITEDLFWRTLENPAHHLHKYHSQIVDYVFVREGNPFHDWMRGAYTTKEIHSLLEKELGINGKELLDIFIEECKTTHIYTEVLAEVKILNAEYITILITDNMDTLEDYILPENEMILEAFDYIDNSYRMRALKTDFGGKYFTKRAKEFSLPIGDCILIDDTEYNCNLFSRLGGKAINVKGESAVVRELRNLKMADI